MYWPFNVGFIFWVGVGSAISNNTKIKDMYDKFELIMLYLGFSLRFIYTNSLLNCFFYDY